MQVFERNEIDAKYKWHLEDIFESNEAWEETFFATEELIPQIMKYSGCLTDSDTVLECLQLTTKIGHELSRLFQYARMRRDEDSRESVYQGMTDRAQMLIVKFSSMSAFVSPELVELPTEKLENMKKEKRFSDYTVSLDDLIRDKNIILSKNEEKLLSEMRLFSGNSSEVFTMFDNADVKFTPIENEKGEKIEMSHGVYSMMLSQPNQELRKQAFESMFGAYKDHINTLAVNYAGNVKKDWFFAKIRGFQSALDYSMYGENVPSTCYRELLSAVNKGLAPLHRYIALRKRLLDIDLNMYDLHVPIIEAQNLAMPYEKAVETVKEALKVMGKEYSDILASAFNDGWIDVYENKGKRSGAYSWGCYGVHPFVLLNYHETTHDVFTVAHELGHALHSYYSNASQCEEKAGYRIFVAEIASTVNEVLLLKHLLKTATGELRKYLLSYYLDMFRTTLFRQTMFSEFEVAAHTMVESGVPVTADSLSNAYYELNKKYYGDAVNHNDLIRYEWARIPHFFTSYYVYKYATGITTAVTIADKILTGGEEYFAKYRKFLSAGGSMAPLDIIRLADVDLETSAPYEKAMSEFDKTLTELEALV